jgi:hypothetical protein
MDTHQVGSLQHLCMLQLLLTLLLLLSSKLQRR